jgi:hypothetical protein
MIQLGKSQLFDLGCASAGIACAIHCILLPFLILAMPTLGTSFFTGEHFEWFLVAITLALAATSIGFGMFLHGSKKALFILLLGAFFLLLARSNHESHDFTELLLHGEGSLHSVETILFAGLGGLLVALSHLINLRLCKHCKS